MLCGYEQSKGILHNPLASPSIHELLCSYIFAGIGEWVLDLVTIFWFCVFGEEIWMLCAFGCGFGSFVRCCLGRFHHSVVSFTVAALAAGGMTFVVVTTVDIAFCCQRLES